MNCTRRTIVIATGTALLALPHHACTQAGADGIDPVGEYTVETSLGAEPVSALLAIVPEGGALRAHFTLPGQSTWSLATVRVEDRTVTLADRFGAAAVSFALRFETDSTFTGTMEFGADRGSVTGRRGADPALVPESPRCADGPGDLPPPSPTRPNTPDPEAARLITSDVALFWDVLDAGPPETLAERLHCDYLRRGTDAVRDFMPGRIVSGERLAEMVTTRRDRYEAARQTSLAMAELEPGIRAMFHELKAMYADAVFPDIYFVVGRFNTGGTVSQRGLLIGAEMWDDHSRVVPIVAHELVHFQQHPLTTGKRTLLAQSIMEGSADFVAELIAGDHINAAAHEYGMRHERELWEEFSRVMHGSDLNGWLYGNPPEGRPADLGYFIGYRITQAYYDAAGQDDRALQEILTVTDHADFLQRSGYDPLATPCVPPADCPSTRIGVS